VLWQHFESSHRKRILRRRHYHPVPSQYCTSPKCVDMHYTLAQNANVVLQAFHHWKIIQTKSCGKNGFETHMTILLPRISWRRLGSLLRTAGLIQRSIYFTPELSINHLPYLLKERSESLHSHMHVVVLSSVPSTGKQASEKISNFYFTNSPS
jgi:hypothetical protein